MHTQIPVEINVDGLVGPTHHYGGLGVGNLASQESRFQLSSPKAAALEGLQKALLVSELGVPQYLFLPPIRPRLAWLSALGFRGKPARQLAEALDVDPVLASAALSSSFMWAANSATVTSCHDSIDRRLHITPANLISSWHRGGEALEHRSSMARLIGALSDSEIHDSLPSIVPLRDEGAANHMRLWNPETGDAIQIFAYGCTADDPWEVQWAQQPNFFARQTLEASQALARCHCLPSDRCFFLQQHPQAIAHGVFHNDVIATSHANFMMHHELAYYDAARQLEEIDACFDKSCGTALIRLVITNDELPLSEAVASYFFNSQIVTPQCHLLTGARMVMICPNQCQTIDSARRLVDRLVADPQIPIDEVRFVSVGQSMHGGGGPACLRLRVPLSHKQLDEISPMFRVTNQLVDVLSSLVDRLYPEQLFLDDFRSESLLEMCMQVPQELESCVLDLHNSQ
ncbi:MAG: N-succinylarginine dihydrolase [Planctomycetales bacterium]|nr:N-succinylarginine dihydrolase [Planctomycetales bacterium]